MVQTARPTSDIAAGSWTTQAGSGSSLFATIDEATADDADYMQSSASPATADVVKIGLGSLTDPVSSSGHHVRYRYKKSVAGGDQIDLTVRLVQGTSTEIASWVHTDVGSTYVDADQTLTGGQADAITDYASLRLWFEAAKGGWTPLSLPSLLAWFEGDNDSLSNGAAMATWDDTSGNNRDAVQASGTLQPLFETAVLNGKPVIRFDATDDYLQVPDFTHNIGTGDFTLGLVFKTPSALSGFKRIVCAHETGTNIWQFGLSGNQLDWFIAGDHKADTVLSTSTWYTALLIRASGVVSFYVNGTADAQTPSISNGIQNSTDLVFGASLSATQPFGSDLAAVVWTAAALSSTDRTNLHAYWRTKYAHY